MEKRFFFEIQLSYAPGCGWLRSPHGRDTFERALEEGSQYARNAWLNGQVVGVRVIDTETHR